MSNKCVNIVVLLILFFGGVSPGLAVSAEPSNAELEFMVDSAREELEAQGEIVKDLREKYEDILKRKKEIQRFIDEENRKNALPGAKKLKKQALGSPGAARETPKNILETGKNEAVKRTRAQERAIAQLEKNSRCRPLPKKAKSPEKKTKCAVKRELTQKTRGEMKREEPEVARKKEEADWQALDMKRQKELQALERKKAAQVLEIEKIKKLEVQKQELSRKKEELEQRKLAAAKQKEQALLDKKLERERLQAEEKENSLIADRERQLKLLLEAHNKAKHDKYVSGLKALEERQNNLLKQSKNFELELDQEEESLKLTEKKWAEAFQRLWEKLSE